MKRLDSVPDQTRVVYADANPCEQIPDAFAEHSSLTVDTASSVSAVADAFDDPATHVECVVTGTTLSDGSWADLLTAVRDRDRALPVVVYPEDVDGRLASEAVGAGATDYLPRPLDDGTDLPARVATAVETYRDRRSDHAEADMFAEFMEKIPISVFFKDADARYVCCSTQLDESVGGTVLRKTDVDLWGDQPGRPAEETYRDDLAVLETGEPVVGKEEHHVADGADLWIETTKFPWHDEEGAVVGLVGVARDVTNQKERERELERQRRQLEQFASFASHDLRNPVNVAQGYLERAVETGDETALREVESALDQMDHLIDVLLTLVRGEDEEGDDAEPTTDLRDVVEHSWEANRTPDATLRIDVPDGTRVHADDGQLRQLLDNLFRNAVDHGGAAVTVDVGLTETGLYVEDDGPGIDPEERDAIFEYGHTSGGTGVGLTIVRTVAGALDWNVSIEESPAGGARFRFDNCGLLLPTHRQATETTAVELPESTDVGDATPPGRATLDDRDSWTVEGGGRDICAGLDEHHFVHGTVDGDVRLLARVTDLEPVHEYSKAGLAVRGGATRDTPLGYVGLSPEHGAEVAVRVDADDKISTAQYEAYDGTPRWFRLDRVGATLTCYTSRRGENWSLLDQVPFHAEGPIAAGLAVCSHDPDTLCTGVFEDVRVVELATDGS